MGDLVNFDEHREMKKRLKRTVDEAVKALDVFRLELHDHAVQVAVEGCLREHVDALPVGAFMNFNDEVLAGSGDPRVVALVHLRAAVAATIDVLRGASS